MLLTSCITGFSQSDSLQIQKIKGKDYYIHVVEKGESLYAIHKKYDVPIVIIKEENPGVKDGLSIGEKVFIPVKRNEATSPTIDGNYIQHTVKKKETLYAISKLYNVKQNEIIAANPELDNGLKEGQLIKIPVKKLKEPSIMKDVDITTKQNQKLHQVIKGETLYSLSKQYETTPEKIKELNNGLLQGLREGESIYVPILSPIKISAIDSIKDNIVMTIDSVVIEKKPVYNVALMLPFYLDENDEMTENRNAMEEKKIYPRSKFAIEFYNGFVKALDEISTDSCKFKVFVYDTKGNDTARIKALLLKPEFKSFDLMVGPLYYDIFEVVAKFALENQIPLVTPVKQNNKILLGNSYVFKVIPSKTSIINPITSLVVDSFRTENLLAIEQEKSKEKALVDLYINAYNKKLIEANPGDTTVRAGIKKLVVSNDFSKVISQLKRDQNNVLFVPTSDQSFVTSFFSYLITTLNRRDYKDYKVTLIGLEEWNKFGNIDLDYFQRLNVHYCNPQYINESDTLTEQFIKRYVSNSDTYPSNNTFLGYDIGTYFGSIYINKGTLFNPDIQEAYKGKSIQFHFMKTGIESGYENTAVSLMRFYDYSIEKLR